MKWLGALRRPVALAILAVALLGFLATPADAAPLVNVSLLQAQPARSVSGNDYAFFVSNQSATTLRCISVQVNTAANGSGLTPEGFDATSASFSGNFMSSWAGWTTSNTTGTAKVTRASGLTPNGVSSAQIMLSGVTNGSVSDTNYYALLRTYSDTGCTSLVDFATVPVVWTSNTSVSTTVDPTLTFSVAGKNTGTCNGAPITGTGSTATSISLGRVDKTTRAIGGQDLMVSTNAKNGFSIYARVDGPLTDDNGHSIANLPADNNNPIPFTDPGTEAFGYTTDSRLSTGTADRFINGGPKWAAMNTSDREVTYSTFATNAVTNCVAYGITISQDTVGGFYGNNVTYTVVPGF